MLSFIFAQKYLDWCLVIDIRTSAILQDGWLCRRGKCLRTRRRLGAICVHSVRTQLLIITYCRIVVMAEKPHTNGRIERQVLKHRTRRCPVRSETTKKTKFESLIDKHPIALSAADRRRLDRGKTSRNSFFPRVPVRFPVFFSVEYVRRTPIQC